MRHHQPHSDDSRGPRPLRIADNAMFVFDDTVRASARPPIDKVEAAMDQGPRAVFREPGATLRPGPGEGVLSVAVDAEETAPVIAVDGRPVAAGAGQLDLVLPAGAHSVEVQSARTAGPVVVRIDQEAVRRVGYYEDPATGHRVLGDFPEALERVGDNSGCLVWLAQAALAVGVVWALVAAFVQRSAAVAVAAAAATALTAAVVLPLSRKAKRTYRRKRAEQLRLPSRASEPHPWGAGGDSDAILRGGADPGVPPGRAAIDLDLECARHLRIGRRKAASGGFLARAWTPPPRVEIDGTARPASWGRWRYAVTPGPHRVSVTVDGRALNVTVPVRHDGAATECGDIEVTAPPGSVVPLRADADVFAVWRARTGQVETRTPTLRLEAG